MIRRIAIGVCLILGLWSAAHYSGTASPQVLPSPVEAMRRLGILLSSGTLNSDFLASGKRWAAGFFLGVLIGAPTGLAMGHSRWMSVALDFPVGFFRSLPVTALFPVFLLVFGIQDASKIAMVSAGTGRERTRMAPSTRSRDLAHSAASIILNCVLYFGVCVHYKRTSTHDWFVERFSVHKQKVGIGLRL